MQGISSMEVAYRGREGAVQNKGRASGARRA